MRFFQVISWLSALLVPASSILADESTTQPLQLLTPQQPPTNAGQPAVPGNLHDIHGPVILPDPVPYLQYGLLLLAAVLLLLALYWWFVKREKPGPPPVPPAVTARDQLMRARELMREEQALGYMERVSDILRGYLEARFNLRTTRQTTRELFISLTGNVQPEHLALTGLNTELKSCLELCDMAKFAHKAGTMTLLQEMEDKVLHIINTTEPDQLDSSSKEDR